MKNFNNKTVVLTGITPSGIPHLGNFIGAIKPSIELSKENGFLSLFFIADYHSLAKLQNPELRRKYINEITATCLALGIDYNKVIFYKQSSIPEILELYWILTTVTRKGILNRSHQNKSFYDQVGLSSKKSINMGIFNYPMLMAADIILFGTDKVPVGKDQIQHIEIAKNIVRSFNRTYNSSILKLPFPVINNENILGIDGRKMSKSYGNTINLFSKKEDIKRLIFKMKTNSQKANEPKDFENCNLFNILKNFSSPDEIEEIKKNYSKGQEWEKVKSLLVEKIEDYFKDKREKYEFFMNNKHIMTRVLSEGSNNARIISKFNLEKIKNVIGI